MSINKIHSLQNDLNEMSLEELRILLEIVQSRINLLSSGNEGEFSLGMNIPVTELDTVDYQLYVIDSGLTNPLYSLQPLQQTPSNFTINKPEVLSPEKKQHGESIQKKNRPSGIWKGKVKIPDNFDDLSSDITSNFGIGE